MFIYICRQQVVVFCVLLMGVSRSKSIRRISVACTLVFSGLGFLELGEMPLRNRTGACGGPVPLGCSNAPPVRSITYVNSGPSPHPEITFLVTENKMKVCHRTMC